MTQITLGSEVGNSAEKYLKAQYFLSRIFIYVCPFVLENRADYYLYTVKNCKDETSILIQSFLAHYYYFLVAVVVWMRWFLLTRGGVAN
jgi:hypothetical protein